jgi:hypothetical protein
VGFKKRCNVGAQIKGKKRFLTEKKKERFES